VRDLPAAVRAKARDAGARAWLDRLPALVDEIAREWGLTVGAAFGDATEAYVAGAVRVDGTPAVLKLLVPRPGMPADHEITVLRLAGGVGCVRLLAADPARGALLLERLGPPMSELGLAQPRRLEILCDLAGAVWRGTGAAAKPRDGEEPSDARKAGADESGGTGQGEGTGAPGVADLPTGAEKAAWLAEHIRTKWESLGRPCAERTVEHALAAAESRRRAYDPARAVLVHGDVHQWNALRAGDGFKLVDPDGLRAEPEYDLGVLMREDPVELMAGDPWDRARWLAARTGTDPVAVWEWGVAERVSTGLVLTAVGLQPIAAEMLAAADAIAAAGPAGPRRPARG
jgi:streptomycin 6-kinase